jgi:hypothetical protein
MVVIVVLLALLLVVMLLRFFGRGGGGGGGGGGWDWGPDGPDTTGPMTGWRPSQYVSDPTCNEPLQRPAGCWVPHAGDGEPLRNARILPAAAAVSSHP